MRAAVMTAPYHIGIEQVAVPAAGPLDVLIEMRAAGICGGDIHFYDGSHPYAQYPQIFGHELCGIVAGAGSEATGLKAGDRVVVEPAIPCGACYPCRIGKYNCCTKIDMIGGWRPGGFADYVVAPAAFAHRIPDTMSFETGSLCEPFSIAAQVVDRAGVRPGSTVAILGMGPIGLAVLILLKRLKQVHVFAVDVADGRLGNASRFGADELINPRTQDVLRTIDERTGGEGANIVIEAAGLKQTMEQSIHIVSPGGRVVIVGLTSDAVAFPGILFTKKEAEIVGSRNNAGKFPEVIEFLDRHPDVAAHYITRIMPFSDIAEALHAAKTRSNEVNKIVLAF